MTPRGASGAPSSPVPDPAGRGAIKRAQGTAANRWQRIPRKDTPMRLRTLAATAALAASLIACQPLAASASPSRHLDAGHNDLRTFCDRHHHFACVVDADDDEGVLVIRDWNGVNHHLRSGAAALRYLRTHAAPCREEDSARCYWDASGVGNHVGDSFIVIGGRAEGTGTLWYLGNLD